MSKDMDAKTIYMQQNPDVMLYVDTVMYTALLQFII